MAEYIQGDYATLLDNLVNLTSTVNRMKTDQNQWAACFGIVDEVFTKFIQVQQLHMDLIWSCFSFANIDNGNNFVEKQRKECKLLEKDIQSLKTNLLERILSSKPDTNISLLPRQFAENASELELSTSERDPFKDVVQKDNDIALVDMRFVSASDSANHSSQIQLDSRLLGNLNPVVIDDDDDSQSDCEDTSKWSAPLTTVDFGYNVTRIVKSEETNIEEASNVWLTENVNNTFTETETFTVQTNMFGTHVTRNQSSLFDIAATIKNEDPNGDVPEGRTWFDGATKCDGTPYAGDQKLATRGTLFEKCSSLLEYVTAQPSGSGTSGDGNVMHCATCGKGFTRKKSLIRHVRRHEEADGGRHVCEVCGKQFRYGSSLCGHMRIHNGEMPFACDVCGKRFNQWGNLFRHSRIHSNERPFPCGRCDKAFRENGDLTAHMRVHSGEKPFQCKVCDRRFSKSGTLIRHVRVHSGEKPYTCKLCGKQFSRKYLLTCHLRIHGSDKPCKCEVCGKPFRSDASVSAHMRRVHEEREQYECTLCEQKFPIKTHLVKHIERYHEED